jgi:hypothetical protein
LEQEPRTYALDLRGTVLREPNDPRTHDTVLSCPWCLDADGVEPINGPVDLTTRSTGLTTVGMQMLAAAGHAFVSPCGVSYHAHPDDETEQLPDAVVSYRLGLRCTRGHGWVLNLVQVDGQIMLYTKREPDIENDDDDDQDASGPDDGPDGGVSIDIGYDPTRQYASVAP